MSVPFSLLCSKLIIVNNLSLLASLVFLTAQSDLVCDMLRLLSALATDFSTCDISNGHVHHTFLPIHLTFLLFFPHIHKYSNPSSPFTLVPFVASVMFLSSPDLTSLIPRLYLSHPQTLPILSSDLKSLIPRP